ncbi:MogA/MoaB family molybdenum cofactor biosynthesis protein [Lignipirellula cremea]|uniref:Molybdenum cofactor biosynthesis protein B n=1 Tax=Lignipirellula cremea TaxID=2528010 RepID=A0A518E0V1_9BACT|nr:MogA/MoaB family molybdenum cofactor biosynthesis protein [Lignipirellula cremea]QDU97713.1 Molybdenum cofactor biosynthesis protein B [Lignipirellula cremea]
MSQQEHKADAPTEIRCAAITVSDTRTEETDTGGKLLVELLTAAGHEITARKILPDEPDAMRLLLVDLSERDDVDAILMTGGTGVSSRDQTYETVSALLTKPLPGYGELFRQLSYEQVGSACLLSRAVGGLLDRTVLLTMPGSPKAVQLAMEKVILPELGHLVREARR